MKRGWIIASGVLLLALAGCKQPAPEQAKVDARRTRARTGHRRGASQGGACFPRRSPSARS